MERAADIAFAGGIPTTVFERDAHPDRSYTINISGHGYRALRHIEASDFFEV